MLDKYCAVGHCRVSRGTKEEIRNSLESQKNEILLLAHKLNIDESNIDWFIEDEARSSFSERANWEIFDKKINEVCKNRNIKYFLAYSQERFCRNSRRSKIYKEKLRSCGVEVRFVCSDIENPETMEGFIMDSTNEMIAQMYSMKVSKDTLRGCKQNAATRDPQTGYTYRNGGQPPFWLMSKEISIGKDSQGRELIKTLWVENTKTHTAVINNKPVTKTMWDWTKYYFLELRLKNKYSIKQCRDIFNELEIPAPRGSKWEHTCLYSAERNPVLYGLGIYNKRHYNYCSKVRIKDESEWIQTENASPALLTKEQFEELAALRKSMTRKEKIEGIATRNDKLFVGSPEKYYCNSCGHRIISSGDFYTCGKYNIQGKAGCKASYFAVPALWLEEQIINDIKKMFNEKTLKKTYSDFIIELKKELTPDKSRIKIVNKDIKKLESKIDSLVKTLTCIAADGNQFAAKALGVEIEKISKQKSLLEQELENLSKKKIGRVPTFEEFKKQSLIAKTLLSPKEIAKKREIVSMFVNAVILDPKEKAVIVKYYKNPFNMLLENNIKTQNTSHDKKETSAEVSIQMVAGAGFEPTTFGL